MGLVGVGTLDSARSGLRLLYVRNVVDDITLLIPLTPAPPEIYPYPYRYAISPSGDHLAFTNGLPMVPEDRNENSDVYVAELAFSE